MKLIDKDAVLAEINRLIAELVEKGEDTMFEQGRISAFEDAKLFLDTLEVKEVDLEKEAELIADGIMISVQANKYNTVVYNVKRNDFNHSHLMLAARKGIELGLKAQKGEEV